MKDYLTTYGLITSLLFTTVSHGQNSEKRDTVSDGAKILIDLLKQEFDKNEQDFSMNRAKDFITEIRRYGKISELIGIDGDRGILNGYDITRDIGKFKKIKNGNRLYIYYYKNILDTFDIAEEDFDYFADKLQEVRGDCYADNGDFSLFIVNSFNDGFSGYMYCHSGKGKEIEGQKSVGFGRLYTTYNEKINGHWYRVSGSCCFAPE